MSMQSTLRRQDHAHARQHEVMLCRHFLQSERPYQHPTVLGRSEALYRQGHVSNVRQRCAISRMQSCNNLPVDVGYHQCVLKPCVPVMLVPLNRPGAGAVQDLYCAH